MKKILTVFVLAAFLFAQAVTPARAVVPLAVYAAAAVGAAVTSAGIGQHYLKTGEMPVYVDKAAGAIASAADMMFTPTVAAYGPLSLVTAASFPSVASVMLGKDAAIGAPLGAILDYAKNATSGAYQALKDFVADNSSEDSESLPLPPQSGDYFPTNTPGLYVQLLSGFSGGQNFSPQAYQDFVSSRPYLGSYGSSSYYFYLMPTYAGHSFKVYKFTPNEDPSWPGYFLRYEANARSYSVNPTNPLVPVIVPGSPNYPDIKDKYKNNPPPGVQNDVQDIIRALGEAGLATPADSIPGTADDVSPPPVITAADVAAAISDIAQGAQAAAQQAAADAAAANDLPGVGAAIAAGNAADAINDAAIEKAQGEAAQEQLENEAEEVSANAPVLEVSPIKAVDFSPITNLTGELSRTFPFGLFTAASSALSVLTVDPVAPSFTINTGLFEKEISFSSMDGFASTFRKVFAFFLYVGTGFLVVRIYSRM